MPIRKGIMINFIVIYPSINAQSLSDYMTGFKCYNMNRIWKILRKTTLSRACLITIESYIKQSEMKTLKG